MSYCRWSSMDWQCDVYVYESERGFETHVATHRRRGRDAKPEPIGRAHDGESYLDDTAEDCAMRLLWLRRAGYTVPQDAITALRAEAADA